MVLSLQGSRYGNRRPSHDHSAAPISTCVVERSRSSEQTAVATPLRAAASNASCTFAVSSGPMRWERAPLTLTFGVRASMLAAQLVRVSPQREAYLQLLAGDAGVAQLSQDFLGHAFR